MQNQQTKQGKLRHLDSNKKFNKYNRASLYAVRTIPGQQNSVPWKHVPASRCLARDSSAVLL
jgi:hypothetical protein